MGLGLDRRVLGRGKRLCKGPEAGGSLAYWEKLENTSGLQCKNNEGCGTS